MCEMFSLIYSPHVICVFAVLHEKVPLRTCYVTCALRRRFVVLKDFYGSGAANPLLCVW